MVINYYTLRVLNVIHNENSRRISTEFKSGNIPK